MGYRARSQSKGFDRMPVDIERILLELDHKLPDYDTQIGLQTVTGIKDPFYATGRITDKNHKEEDFIEFLFDLPYTNSILSEHGVYRTRVMRMHPKTCYTYHQDWTKRFHLPLITNDNCFFIIDDEIFRYPANGDIYIADTTKKHTFVNASLEERIHIVGCINES
jgi:hypothetical protein